MNKSTELNPYTPSEQVVETAPKPSLLLFRVCLVIAALNLLLHGAWMIFEYYAQFSSMPSLADFFASNFSRAMLLKDSITGGTALFAAILIFCRQRVGWWLAVMHWHWYLAWNAIVVIVAESFAWQFPVRFNKAEIVTQIVKCLIYSSIAIVFFNLKPIRRILNVSIERPLPIAGFMIVGTASIALFINWWSSIR